MEIPPKNHLLTFLKIFPFLFFCFLHCFILEVVKEYFYRRQRKLVIPLSLVLQLTHLGYQIIPELNIIVHRLKRTVYHPNKHSVEYSQFPKLSWTYVYGRKTYQPPYPRSISAFNILPGQILHFSKPKLEVPVIMGDEQIRFVDAPNAGSILDRPAPGEFAARNLRGPANNAQYFSKWLKAEALFGELIVATVDCGVLQGNMAVGCVGPLVHLLCSLRFRKKGGSENRQGAIVLAMAELHGAFIPNNQRILEVGRARQVIVDMSNYATQAILEDMGYEGVSNNALLAVCGAVPDNTATELAICEYAINRLSAIAEQNSVHFHTSLQLLTQTLIAYAKRGMVTPEFMGKMSDGMRTAVGTVVKLDATVIEPFYLQYGYNVNAANAQEFFSYMLGIIPAHAVRLGLMIQQVARSGITQLLICQEAMSVFPTFPWSVISRMLPDEWATFTAAVRLVNGNPFYGFSKELGIVKSTGYQSLTWLCKELLTRSGMQTTLRSYTGISRNIKKMGGMKTVMDKFLDKQQEAPIDENYDGSDYANEAAMVEFLRESNTLYAATGTAPVAP